MRCICCDAVAEVCRHQFTVLWGLGIVEHPVLSSGNGILGACVDDRLKQAVKLGHVLLRFHQQFLHLLLHGKHDGCIYLLLSETVQVLLLLLQVPLTLLNELLY